MAGFFFTGQEDAALTPSAIDRKRQLINALARENLSTAPVGHWTQALARVLGAGADVYQENRLNAAEKKGMDENKAAFMAALGIGGGGVSPSIAPIAAAGAPPSPTPPAAAPSPNVSQETMPAPNAAAVPTMAQQPQAAALIRSFEGYRPTPYWDVNAHRVGYGSDTITNPDGSVQRVQPGMRINRDQAELDLQRRISTEFQPRAAAAVGASWEKLSPQAQAALTSVTYNYGSLPKSVAAAAQTGDPNAIAAAVEGLSGHNGGVNANRRMQEAALIRALGSGQPVSVPPGAPPGTPPAQINPMPTQMAEAPAPGASPAQFNVPGQGGANPRTAALLQALSSPWAAKNPMLAGVASKVLGEQLTGNKLTYQTLPDGTILALDPTGRRPPTPVYQAPTRPQFGVIGEDEFGNKRYGFINPVSQQVTPYSGPQAPAISGAPSAQSGGTAQQPNSNRIPPAPPGVNPKIWRDEQTKKLVNPDKLTEGQSKDVGFYTRGVPANEALTKLEGALIAKGDVAASKVPLVGNMLVSGEFQKAQNSARDFLAVILRKDTGAAVTPQEFDTYGEIFLPRAGDGPEVIAQKRESRARALEGMRLGLGSVKEIVDFAKPKTAPAAAVTPSATGSGWKEIAPGVRIREVP